MGLGNGEVEMPEHPNAAVIRRAYEVYASGDAAAMREQFTDNVVWHIKGAGDFDGDYTGPDAVLGFLGRLAAETEGTFRLDVHAILADDEHGVALLTATGQRKGRTANSNIVHVTHLRDGKTAEFWAATTDPAGDSAFWS